MFTVVLLDVGNNLATLPGRTANQKFKGQFLVLREAKYVDFEREIRVSGLTQHVEMVKGIYSSQMPTVRVRQLNHSGSR